jgi:hypothetical protein
MMQLARRRSVLVCAIALAAAALVIATVLATDGTAPAVAESPAEEMDGAGGTLPVGSPLPSAELCAVHANQAGSDRETVPENDGANQSVPTDLRLPPWPDYWDPSVNLLFIPRIDGQYTGTTDRILVWGACKWGVSTDVVRAMAMAESSWRQSKVGDYVDDPSRCVGDYSVPCPTSFGILQIKHIYRPGSWPDSQQHTAFNVDYALAVLRGCFEGWVNYLGTGNGLDHGYAAGDLWGCVGWHYSGKWNDAPALKYVQRVRDELDARYWDSW